MKGRHCIGLNWRNLAGYVSLNQYNVFLSYSREEIRLVENSLYILLAFHSSDLEKTSLGTVRGISNRFIFWLWTRNLSEWKLLIG